MVMSKMVGASVRRKEDPRLITGSSTYVDDLKIPGMLHAIIVRSIEPHGTITGYDTATAASMPGVVAVYTGEDLESLFANVATEAVGEGDEGDDGGIPKPPVSPLAQKTVRYVGHPVAMVVAKSRAEAVDAAEMVLVDIDPLPVITDVYEAIKDDAPRIYANVPNNIGAKHGGHRGGNVDDAFADATWTIKNVVRSPRLNAVPMEGRAVAAQPDPVHGLTVWTSTQAPHWNRNAIASALGLSQAKVRVIAPEVGGGFGQKIGAYYEDYLIAAAAHKLKQPVKWIETRSENMLASSHGRNQIAEVEAAMAEDGKITALRCRVLVDAGAWPKGLDLGNSTFIMATGCYDIPAIEYNVLSVYTNTGANGAYRGAGRPEAAFYIERIVDLLADESGLDPVDIRRRNFIQPNQFPFDTLSGQQYDSGDYDKALDKALEIVDYNALRQEQARLREEGRYIGIGLASYVEICGFGPFESSTVRVEPGGHVSIFTGISPHGQGQETTFAQMAADVIGADFDDVVVHHGDTANTPQGNGTMGSRGLAVGGAALMASLRKIQEKAKAIAAHILEASIEDIEVEGGKFRVKGVPDTGVTLSEISAMAYSGNLPKDMEGGLETTDFFRPSGTTFPFGSHIAVVEVFPDTGETKWLRYVSVDDCGPIMSPVLVTGQVHGGLAQGIGQAMIEEMHYAENGELLTGTLNDYAMPRASSFPTFETHHTTTPTYINEMGVKGIGEAATIGATPAAANAVIDALAPWGVTHVDIPLTPQKVWKAIRGAEAANAAD